MSEWNVKEYRFVALLDILGFKDLVFRSSHEEVIDKLSSLKDRSSKLDDLPDMFEEEGANRGNIQSKSFIFSDTFIIFSKSHSFKDAFKILTHSLGILDKGVDENVPLKGAISYGEVSMDEDESLFFGEPLINAHLLHEELEASAIVLDHNAENKIKRHIEEDEHNRIGRFLKRCPVPLKSGNITHSVAFAPGWKNDNKDFLGSIDLFYQNTSGKHRRYIDNTKRLYESLIQE